MFDSKSRPAIDVTFGHFQYYNKQIKLLTNINQLMQIITNYIAPKIIPPPLVHNTPKESDTGVLTTETHTHFRSNTQ